MTSLSKKTYFVTWKNGEYAVAYVYAENVAKAKVMAFNLEPSDCDFMEFADCLCNQFWIYFLFMFPIHKFK